MVRAKLVTLTVAAILAVTSMSIITATPAFAGWAELRKCESSGNYGSVSKSGKYRGAYQFDMGTWHSNGGTGDPAAASPEEQDRIAQRLYASRGASPWPHCGRHLGGASPSRRSSGRVRVLSYGRVTVAAPMCAADYTSTTTAWHVCLRYETTPQPRWHWGLV